ncbi:MAG: 4Fe-4S dicluster domain-containing protein [Anaerolineae bacterium]|nr:4Fe-4S dicluster domain-containing protein [Anaerolineae bacterium]
MSVAQEILAETGVDVKLCLQCRRCTASCPVAEYYDLYPHEMIRRLQHDRADEVLDSRMMWQCAQCEACAERCPQGIEIVRVVDLLRIRAQRQRRPAAVPAVPLFYRAALSGIRLFGRMYELGLMARLYLSLLLRGRLDLRQLWSLDLPVGLGMLQRGKLPPLPHRSGRARPDPLKPGAIAYYPGCSLHGTSKEYDQSARAVFEALGRPLQEPQGWGCCGTTPAHSTDEHLAALLPYRNLALLQRMGAQSVTMPCPSCYLRSRAAQQAVSADEGLARRIAEETGADVAHPLDVQHTLMTVTREIGLDAVRQRVRQPLSGLKVVCYYGCAVTRPSYLTQEDEVEDPRDMEQLMEAVGCQVLEWSYKVECCGVSHSITQLPLALDLTRRILDDASAVGADAVVVACPLCHTNLDTRQGNIARTHDVRYNMPVLYFTQVMGLAFGLPEAKLALGSHFVDPRPLVRERAGSPQ